MSVIAILVGMLAAQTTAPADPSIDPITKPVWISQPGAELLYNCTAGYLTDPTFQPEPIAMACMVGAEGRLSQCRVKESKTALAAGVQEVALCTVPAFRAAPLDEDGKVTAGRPVVIRMGIAAVGVTQGQPAAGPKP